MPNPEPEKPTVEVEVTLGAILEDAGDMLNDAYPYVMAGIAIAPVAMAIAGVAVPAALVSAGITGFWAVANHVISPD
jgi:hypothetical protein